MAHDVVNPTSLAGTTDPSGNPAGNSVIAEFLRELAQERNVGTANQYGVGVDECSYHAWATATGDEAVTTSAALVFGVLVTVDTAGGAVEIRDSSDATGTVVLSIPAGSTSGTMWDLKGCKFDNGIFIDDASTSGSLIVFWRAQ